MGGWGRESQPRWQLLWAFPSATTFWSVAPALHMQTAVIVLHMGKGQENGTAQGSQSHTTRGSGGGGRARRSGPGTLPGCILFSFEVDFHRRNHDISSFEYLKNGANWSPSHSSLFIVTASSQACCERSHESPAQEISASFVYSIDCLSLVLILSMYILPQSVASDRRTAQSRM